MAILYNFVYAVVDIYGRGHGLLPTPYKIKHRLDYRPVADSITLKAHEFYSHYLSLLCW